MSEWISVEDRLPAEGQSVLLYTDSGICEGEYSNPFGRGLRFYDTYTCNGPACYGGLDRVTHWMPLPEPPQ